MITISSLQERKNTLIANATVMVNAKKENTPEYRKLLAELDDVEDRLGSLKRLERLQPAQSAAPAPAIRTEPIVAPVLTPAQTRSNVHTAYRHFLRHGLKPNSSEQRGIVTSSDSSGGALIPQEFTDGWVSALKFHGPIASLVKNILKTTGRPTKFKVSDSTAGTMSYLSEEGSTSALNATPTLFSSIPATDTLVTKLVYSWQELEDATDLESFIVELAGENVARSLGYALTLG